MAARWIPEEGAPIAPSEYVGRRLFDIPKLAGAEDQKLPKDFLEATHFLERRSPGDVSVDRLGRTGVESKIANWLLALGRNQGKSFKPTRTFDGWVSVSVRKLVDGEVGSIIVVASPVEPHDPEKTGHNPYHAHVPRLPIPEAGIPGFLTALALRHVFVKHGEIRRCDRVKGAVHKFRDAIALRLRNVAKAIKAMRAG